MKKVLGALIIIAVIVLGGFTRCTAGIGLGLGLGPGRGNGDGNNPIEVNNDANEEQVAETESEDTAESSDVENENKETIIKVSVAGSDYFYENEKIELDLLLQRIKKTEGRYVVEIKDEQASKKAYEALIKSLKKENISYTEK